MFVSADDSVDPPDTAAKEPKEPRRYRGQSPDERREQRRRRLLDAALELFATAGYANTSVERLCSTSGVTGRHFYEEFASREALLKALFDDIILSGLDRVVERVEAGPAELGPRLVAGVGEYVHLLLDDPRRARIVTVEVVGVSRDLESHRRGASGAFATFIQSQADELTKTGIQIQGNELTALALVAAVHELTAAWLEADPPISIDAVIDEGVRIITAVAGF